MKPFHMCKAHKQSLFKNCASDFIIDVAMFFAVAAVLLGLLLVLLVLDVLIVKPEFWLETKRIRWSGFRNCLQRE